MSPVAAITTVFALVLSVIAWVRLIAICTHRGPVMSFFALLLPPVALIALLPEWRTQRDLFHVVGAALVFSSIAALY